MTTFSRIIERYGEDAEIFLRGGESVRGKCFVQPVLRRTYERTFEERTAHGIKDTARYYGFFSDGMPMEKCEYVASGAEEYEILKAEPYRVGGTLSHWETLMVKREEEYVG